MKKKLIVIALLLVLLASCGAGVQTQEVPDFYSVCTLVISDNWEHEVYHCVFDNGDICYIYDGSRAGGMSCEFAEQEKLNASP